MVTLNYTPRSESILQQYYQCCLFNRLVAHWKQAFRRKKIIFMPLPEADDGTVGDGGDRLGSGVGVRLGVLAWAAPHEVSGLAWADQGLVLRCPEGVCLYAGPGASDLPWRL